MQNNNNYASNLDPELRGSVDYDFFGLDDDAEIGNKENLSSIEENDVLSRVSGDNSLKSGPISELGGGKRDKENEHDRSTLPPVPPATASKTSSSTDSPVSSPRQASSIKSESTVRSGGFPPLSRGDSARPQSPTPPSSHASPSPHRVASGPRSVSPDSPRSPELSISRRSSSASSRNSSVASSPRSEKISSRGSRESTPRSRCISPETSRRSSPSSSRSPSPETSRRSRASSSASKHSSDEGKSSPPTSRRSKKSSSSPSSSSSESSRSRTPEKERARSSVSSESDVTDVSPLSSHQHSPLGSPSPARKSQAQVQVFSQPDGAEIDDDRTNVELIMKAILELDRERQRSKRPKSASGKQGAGRRQQEAATCHRPYHSTINRIREQRRIEEENRSILKRLTAIRPTPNMRRDQQLREYERQCTYGAVPTTKTKSATKDLKSGNNRSVASAGVTGRTSSLKRRPASAKSGLERSSSASSVGLRSSSRPEWPSGW